MRNATSLALTFALVTVATPTFAEDFPDRIVSLIKANDQIGLSSNTNTGERFVTILTPAEYQLAKDLSTLDISQVAAKHPDIAEQVSQLRKEGDRQREQSLAKGIKLGETKVSMNVHVGELCKVLHVGQDFIVVEFSSPKLRRVAIASSKIVQVSWGLSPIANVSHQVNQ